MFIRAHPLQIVKGVFAFAGSLLDVIPSWPLKHRILLPIAGGSLVVGFLLVWAVRLLLTTLSPASLYLRMTVFYSAVPYF